MEVVAAGRPGGPASLRELGRRGGVELPVSSQDRPSLSSTEFVACFLKHYEVAVFSIEDARPWEDVPSLGACDELVQKQL